MVFSTIIFLCAFLPIVIIGYYLLPNICKNIWLLLASIFFYAWGEPKFVWVMLGNIACNYFFGILIAKLSKQKKESNEQVLVNTWMKKSVLFLSVVLNLGLLFWMKYFTFVTEILNDISEGKIDIIQIALPIGISFYTFQGLSYVIDVYRKEGTVDASGKRISIVQKNPLQLALYIAMFPQLIAGPIVRYTDIQPYLKKREHSFGKFAMGAERFIVGLGKKAILANMIGEMADSIMNSDVNTLSMSVAWLGAIAYTLQIYFDFSGYSDMAIGLGKIFGFEFMENFDYPYISRSIKEFWRRWHISLSSWFRDYLYIPLGGSRKGNVYVNLFIVFLATGIWHGAAWGFIAWGVYHGVFRLLEYFIEQHSRKKNCVEREQNQNDDSVKDMKIIKLFQSALGWIYTMVVVIVGWVVFAKVNLKDGLDYLAIMFGIRKNEFVAYDVSYYLGKRVLFFLVIGMIACVPWKQYTKNFVEQNNLRTEQTGIKELCLCFIKRSALLMLLVLSFVFIINSSYNPFIYFRF